MEYIINFFQSVLGLKARQGWIFFISGGVIAALCLLAPAPYNFDNGWLTVSSAVCIFGATILVVSLGSVIYSSLVEFKDRLTKSRALEAKSRQLAENSVRNLKVLNDHERVCLAFILKKGKQRFNASSRLNDTTRLVEKGIIRYDDPKSRDIFAVTESVWEMREQLIDDLPDIRMDLRDAPWVR
ncbi:hypothetical protein [Phyllobacterium zundukense]|uniref:Uncharacterized protein n=1 Tax=Phyllobacterium zundukense TaxID=1867719 RepID=A0ACD4D9L7_9HYPH|nr:hypothetical protein [Phyllobacterium zundukense]UXN62449.1 hypothetical protein N8E88_20970 [Phyllobacterium zundukense]